ncbi:hypothetical protein T4D_7435 [Trichinella pseudospiralis]|uniref:Uncharacterized protein n=1 Tax=Trichinella pseudospiralis TaxID=6337 RepID=A0A0V1DN38_TRIPS|nr:hypothetical protein T4D_7435 [Trichinella pseudospiralis]
MNCLIHLFGQRVMAMHQMEYVCFRLLKIFILFGMVNPGTASWAGVLCFDGVPFPGIGSCSDGEWLPSSITETRRCTLSS